ncbi:hypothetical protein CRX72_16045 [Pantoea sp. BRM17]|nr:hypothetical protein CRX72_16045 [Pantoea sp. BRM17]
MKVHISADYQSETWFYPAYTLEGQLTAVELVTQFVHVARRKESLIRTMGSFFAEIKLSLKLVLYHLTNYY